MKRDLMWLSALVVVAFGILVSLGVWQLQRMAWKKGLNAQIMARTGQPPVTLTSATDRWKKTNDVEYLKVRFKGHFRHAGESHYFTTSKGISGWQVITPLETSNGRIVMVDRGFVPDARKLPGTRDAGQMEGEQTITGLARAPGKQNFFVPDNEPENNQWFWRDLNGMAAASLPGGDVKRVTPFFVEADATPNPGGLPRGGVTRVVLPNTHLQYALTWFGLAAALLGVFGVYVRGRIRRHAFT